MSCHKGFEIAFILLYFIILGGAVGAGGHSQLWAEPKAKGTCSTNPTEAEKGEQEEEIEWVCACVCVYTDWLSDSVNERKTLNVQQEPCVKIWVWICYCASNEILFSSAIITSDFSLDVATYFKTVLCHTLYMYVFLNNLFLLLF